MRNLILPLLALFLTVPALGATENAPDENLTPEVVPAVVAESAPDVGAELQLTEIELEERTATADDAAAAQLGPRGGFWWIVGVIVIAGVILAVVL